MIYQDANYTVARDPSSGLVLRRLRDGAEVFFQPGDDAADFEDQCATVEQATAQGRTGAAETIFSQFFGE